MLKESQKACNSQNHMQCDESSIIAGYNAKILHDRSVQKKMSCYNFHIKFDLFLISIFEILPLFQICFYCSVLDFGQDFKVSLDAKCVKMIYKEISLK